MASNNNPVFDNNDRVNDPPGGGGDNLEAELAGKSPKEIAQIMRDREARIRSEATPPNRNQDPPPPTNTEFWNDPNASVDRKIAAKALSRSEYEQVAASLRPTLRWAAKNIVKEQHSDFARVEKDIDEIMKKVPEHLHTDPVMWETCYVQAKGNAYERLSAEDRAAPVISAERVGPGGTPAPVEEDLSKVTLPGVGGKTAAHVADKLGVAHASYRKSRTELEGEGKLPITVDNRGRK